MFKRFIINSKNYMLSNIKNLGRSGGCNHKNLKVLFYEFVFQILAAYLIFSIVIWLSHFVFMTNKGYAYKFFFMLSFLVPGLSEFRGKKSFLDILISALKVATIPFILVLIFKLETLPKLNNEYDLLSIDNFFKNMSFFKSSKGACFLITLFLDQILNISTSHMQTKHEDFRKSITNFKDLLVLFIGLHFGLDYFVVGIVCLAFKDVYFKLNLALRNKMFVNSNIKNRM